MLNIKITSPIESALFLLINIASTSVPSITAPHLILSPIHRPKKNPQNTAIRSLSSVTIGKCVRCTMVESSTIAIILLIAKFLPIVEYPIIINGILITMSRIERGRVVSSLMIREIPVTQPSINEFGRRKALRAKLAEIDHKTIKILSWRA